MSSSSGGCVTCRRTVGSALHIHRKDEKIDYLRLNPVQRALHDALEAQRDRMGIVRALILKARQMGVSTYVAARFFLAMHFAQNPVRAYILAHDDSTSKKLLAMYALMWERHAEVLRVGRTRSNDHWMELENGSHAEAHTASTPTGGRGGTISRFHGSEVAWWDHTDSHMLGSMQQVPKEHGSGSEIILESTANGATGAFYERWRSAEQGRGDYVNLFFPFTMMPQYQMQPPPASGCRATSPTT